MFIIQKYKTVQKRKKKVEFSEGCPKKKKKKTIKFRLEKVSGRKKVKTILCLLPKSKTNKL